MTRNLGSSRLVWALGGALVVAAGFAFLNPAARAIAQDKVSPTSSGASFVSDDPPSTDLPPGHPPIGKPASNNLEPSTDVATIQWTVPTSWHASANVNAMRLATYVMPRAAGDSEDAELSVARAGGSVEANAQRWAKQFDDIGTDTRTPKTTRNGFHVTIVNLSGTYLGGGMTPGAKSESHARWALLGAIVETDGSPYFFKLLGPVASVRAASAAFHELIETLHDVD